MLPYVSPYCPSLPHCYLCISAGSPTRFSSRRTTPGSHVRVPRLRCLCYLSGRRRNRVQGTVVGGSSTPFMVANKEILYCVNRFSSHIKRGTVSQYVSVRVGFIHHGTISGKPSVSLSSFLCSKGGGIASTGNCRLQPDEKRRLDAAGMCATPRGETNTP